MSKREAEMLKSSREREKREHSQLMEYNMGYVSPTDLPHGLARDGYEYYWASKDIRGEITYEVEQLCAKGWELIPSDRCPGYNPDPLKRNPYSSQYFTYRDVILLERPQIMRQPEDAAFYRFLNHRTNSIQEGGTKVKNDFPGMRANSYNPNSINSF